ncbi:MAG: ATP-binding protein [Burkholderiaceae bacterium]|nr:ATP-binding protein [Burkholderiaceae bacterium]
MTTTSKESALLLPHQNRLVREIEVALSEVLSTDTSRGILFVGESGTGKSHAFNVIESHFATIPTNDVQQRATVVRADLRAATSTGAIIHALLTQLGRPNIRPATKLDTLEWMLHDAFTAYGTLILLMEEMHNGLVREAKAFAYRTAELMKGLWNRTTSGLNSRGGEHAQKLVIVVSGLPVLLDVFAKDAELASRYSSVIEAPYLSLSSSEDIRLVRQVINEFRKRFGLAQLINPNDNDIVMRLYLATSMHLRHLEKLFARAQSLLARQPRMDSGLELLKAAYPSALGIMNAPANPFEIDRARLEDAVATVTASRPLHKAQSRQGSRAG